MNGDQHPKNNDLVKNVSNDATGQSISKNND